MPKAIRYRHGSQYLKNTLFWTTGDFIGAFHADPALGAAEEALTIASHKRDFAAAFGIPESEIVHEVLAWDGDSKTLPLASDASAPVGRLPAQPAPPAPPTLLDILAADPSLAPATKAALAALKAQ